ncbi:PIF1 helicase-like protein [Perkinsela sp. CCAP 1560/4]|nr:PIF1 helicase-like protein [Perkinsela sp. CCAP 1560/4]|eukprot:KNH07790.1 PIF1 helicase-like protein [Perkinsela sp. CCAP 1560/4]
MFPQLGLSLLQPRQALVKLQSPSQTITATIFHVKRWIHSSTSRRKSRLEGIRAFTDPKWSHTDALAPSADQEKALKLALERKCLYLGGPAGTGKTHVLHRIYRHLTSKRQVVLVTASTGIAAQSMNGRTFQHFFGIRGDCQVKLIEDVDCILLDEVSMMFPTILENFDATARLMRGSAEPFGGIRMILCGDFLQLPPVAKDKAAQVIFEHPLFRDNFYLTALHVVHRVYAEYSSFREGLAKLRYGQLTSEMYSLIRSRAGTPDDELSDATYLFLTRHQAAHRNLLELEKIPGESLAFPRVLTEPKLSSTWTSSVAFTCSEKIPPALRSTGNLRSALNYVLSGKLFARGAPSDALVLEVLSETADVATYFTHANTFWFRRFAADAEDKAATLRRNLIRAIEYIGGDIVHGQGDAILRKVSPAIDRCTARDRVGETIHLRVGARVMLTRNLTPALVNGSIGVVEDFVPAFDGDAREALPSAAYDHVLAYARITGEIAPVLPVVRFESNLRVLIPPVAQWVGRTKETAQFHREMLHIPLLLAYAFTIHKVQGLTLTNQVVIDFRQAHPCPHLVYVALSRVRSPTQLVVKGFSRRLIQTCPKAMDFEKRLLDEKAQSNT